MRKRSIRQRWWGGRCYIRGNWQENGWQTQGKERAETERGIREISSGKTKNSAAVFRFKGTYKKCVENKKQKSKLRQHM